MKNTGNRLSDINIYSILLVCHIFSFVCFSGQMGAETLLAVCVSFVIRTFAMCAIYILYRKGFCFSDFLAKYKFTAVFIYFYMIINISYSFIKIRNVSEQISMPISSSLLCTFIIIIVCSYTASLGIKALGNIGLVFLVLSAAAFIIIPMTAFSKLQISSVYFSDDINFISKSAAICSGMSEPLLLLCYMPYRKEKQLKKFKSFVFTFLAADLLLCILCISLLHRKIVLFEYPFFAAVNAAQPFEFQRADAFYSLIFVLLSVFRLTALTVPASEILRVIFPNISYKIILTLILSGILSFAIFKLEVLNSNFVRCLILAIFIISVSFGAVAQKSKKGAKT